MDGKTLKEQLDQLLAEDRSTSGWINSKYSFDLLYNAAVATVSRTRCLTSTQDITTVDGTSGYRLNGDFLKLYLTDDQNRFYVKYYDGTSYSFIYYSSYDSIYLANNTAETAYPDTFTIKDSTALTRYTGTASAVGAATNGECTLTDTTATFTNVYPGDMVHNTTDGSDGIVIVKTSNTALITCLFNGTNNDWTATDAYIVVPQMRFQLIVDPPSSTSAYTITVPYIQKPTPVYSDYRAYNLPSGYEDALVCYAAWKYRYKDREPNFGDALYRHWDATVRNLGKDFSDASNRKGFRVNMVKSSSRSWNYK